MSQIINSFNHPRHMEPLLPEAKKAELAELSCTILTKAGQLRGQIHSPRVRSEVSRLVREMNCYYSNLIEGHKTRPREIEQAIQKNFSDDPKQKENQELSVAHILTETAMVERLKAEPDLDVVSPEFIAWIHQDFYERLPTHLHMAKTLSGKSYRIFPGQWRDFMVDVGHHTPPDFKSLPSFLGRFHSFYGGTSFLETERLVAIAAAHHRLGWIHPFGDGNGRVMRLHSHALLRAHHLDGDGLWTLSRGLARNKREYYRLLETADQPRRRDLDGRGNLTDKGLADFCIFFLHTILDQVSFMGGLLELPTLRERVKKTFQLELLHLERDAEPLMKIVSALLDHGELQRKQAQEITGMGATSTARIIKRGLNEKLFTTPSPKGVLHIHLGSSLQESLFPKLFLDLPVEGG